jgi:hypothetical protein
MDDELVVATSRAGRWTTETRLGGCAPRCLAVDPLRPERVVCGTSGRGLWTSDDLGFSWTASGSKMAHLDVTAVAVSPTERSGGLGVVYAGTEPSALLRSEDGGAWRELPTMHALPSAPTWSFPPRPYTSHVRWIALDPHRVGALYVCIEAGALVRSFDAGETWLDRVPDGPWDTHTLAVHPLAPGRLYSAAGDGFVSAGRGYNESPDGGERWEHPDAGIERHYLWGIAVDPEDPETIVVSAAASPTTAHSAQHAESTIYRRAGRGAWQEVRHGLPPVVGTTRTVLAANPAEPRVFYAASNRGLFRSTDAGLGWERLDIVWPDRYLRQSVNALVVAA